MLLYISTPFGHNFYRDLFTNHTDAHSYFTTFIVPYIEVTMPSLLPIEKWFLALMMVCWFSMHAEINSPILGDNKMNIKVEWELMVSTAFIF